MKAVGALALFMVLTATAYGQGPYKPRTYVPSSPTLSPYLDYFRPQEGLLDNYHNYVRPSQQLQGTIQQQNAAIQRNASRLGNLRFDVTNLQDFRQSIVSPTGHGATYMNYSHYFPSMRAAASRR